MLIPSSALDRGRRSDVGLDAAAGVDEAALRHKSHHSPVVGPAARVAPPLDAGWLPEEEGELTSLGPSREEDWEILINNGALQA